MRRPRGTPARSTARSAKIARYRGAFLLALAALAAGCGSSPPPRAVGPQDELTTAKLPGTGEALVDGEGYTLYMFVPDKRSAPTCYSLCAAQWPPLLLPPGVSAPEAGPGVNPALLGSVRRRDGELQATYNRWPLYLFIHDVRPGEDTGQGLDNLGGLWYVLSPAGVPVRR